LGSGVVVTVTPAPIVMDKGWAGDVAPALSLTVMLKENVPLAVGVPVIAPLAVFRVKPLGSDPVLTVQLL
jgi:hypothetical protein